MARQLSEDIDGLLEKYLHLLDQYTTLRSQLNAAQSSIHQHIARANFSAERGIRYGRDLYDARMQASRLCRITDPARPPGLGTSAPFALSTFAALREPTSDGARQAAGRDPAGVVGVGLGELKLEDAKEDLLEEKEGKEEKDGEEKEEKIENTPKNPLRMFGILTPPSLRLAQTTAVDIVENLVPAIASLDLEMKEVEIQIRRARKYKLKAESLEAAEEQKNGGDEEKEVDLSKQFLAGKRETTISS